jgi:hypothetical protein
MSQTILQRGAIDSETRELTTPENASKSRRYNCPDCNVTAIFASGKVIPPYFRHKAATSDCSYYTKESLEHLEAKQYIANLLEMREHTIKIERVCAFCNTVFDLEIEPLKHEMSVVQEHSFTYNGLNCRADIAVVDAKNEIFFIVEICKSNPTNCEKRPEPWFEFDATAICNSPSSTSLKCIRTTFVGDERYYSTCGECQKQQICSGPQGKIYFNQRGAGCGKTYESIQLLASSQFQEKTTFIYLTKMNSATTVIYEELMSQIQHGKLGRALNLVNNVSAGNQRRVTLDIDEIRRNVIIGTIDSFTYAIRDSKREYFGGNMFEQIVRDIAQGKMSETVDYEISYARAKHTLSEKHLIIIDEAQDLGKEYLEAFIKVIDKTGIDTYIIGDKLQSISNENNLFTWVEGIDEPRIIKDASKNINVVKRFHNPEFMHFVNGIVPFAKCGLPEISGICDGKCAYSHDATNDPVSPIEIEFEFPNIYDFDKDELDLQLQKITGRMRTLVIKCGYLPSNFCFIMPIVNTNNKLLTVLEPYIQHFWCDIFSSRETYSDILLDNMQKENEKSNGYWTSKLECREDDESFCKYIYWHRSEGNQPINLNESKCSSRILSIHASKGTGCECVFFLGISQQSLCCFTGGVPNTLVYESLLHVGLTRQKKYLYVGIDKQDTSSKKDIYRRFKPLSSDEPDVEPDISSIRNYLKLSIIGEDILANETDKNRMTRTEIMDFIDGNKYLHLPELNPHQTKKETIDWGHHVIRRSVLCANTHKYLSNQIDQHGQQLFAMHSTLSKDTKLEYVNYSNYSKIRYELQGTIKYNSKNNKKNGLIVPILVFNEGRTKSDYAEFRLAIQSVCESVIAKLRVRNLCFCPIECVVYDHLMSMIQHPFKIAVGIMDIYTILYYYRDFYTKPEFDQDRHTKTYSCKCHSHFASSRKCSLTANTKIKNAIVNHYLSVERIDNIMRSYDETVRTISNNQHIDYKIDHTTRIGNDICLQNVSSWTGYSPEKDFIVSAITCPQLNAMNILENVVELFLTHCIRIIEWNDDKPRPTILFAIIHLDSETPLFINFADVLSDDAKLLTVKEELKRQITKRYEPHHKTAYEFFDYHRNRDRKISVSKIEHLLKLLKTKKECRYVVEFNRFFRFPNYIAEWFKSIDQEYPTAKLERKDEIRIGLEKIEWVVNGLNDHLDYVVNRMLLISREDDY